MTGDVDKWFVRPAPRGVAAVRLFCLPYAGAGAGAFRRWPAVFGSTVDIVAVRLPGRETRFREPAWIDEDALARAVAAYVDGPYAVYGHSMGGRLAFEVVRRLRRLGTPMPVHLFVAACRAPDRTDPGVFDGLSALPDEELIARLSAAGGIPPAVLAEPELLALLLPAIRADFGWLDAYRYRPEPPLPVPVTAFAADQDPTVAVEQVAAWRDHTSAGFTLRTLAGGHFILHERLTELATVIGRALCTQPDTPGGGRYLPTGEGRR